MLTSTVVRSLAPGSNPIVPDTPANRPLTVEIMRCLAENSTRECEGSMAQVAVRLVAVAVTLAVAERRGVTVDWQCADLSDLRLPPAQYDLIVNIHYVNRDLTAQFAEALRPGGHVLFEQHLRWPTPVDGPGSDHFRLRPGELRHLLWQLDILHYAEGPFDGRDGERLALARAVGLKHH